MPRSFALRFALALASSFVVSSAHSALFPDDTLPPPGGYLQMLWPANFLGGRLQLTDARLGGFQASATAPKRSGQMVTLQTAADMSLAGSLDGVAGSANAMAGLTLNVTNSGRSGKTHEYTLELVGLEVATPAFLLRESPTLPSFGRATVTRMPGGKFDVLMFVDVFFEASLDGGLTWSPAVDASNQPVQTRLLLLGP